MGAEVHNICAASRAIFSNTGSPGGQLRVKNILAWWKVQRNRDTERVIGDDEASRLLDSLPRKGFELPVVEQLDHGNKESEQFSPFRLSKGCGRICVASDHVALSKL
jgi:hypothetical protein